MIAVYVARGTVLSGLRASSLNSAVASKPRNAVAARSRPIGREPEKTATGENAAMSKPVWTRTDTSNTIRIATSRTSETPSTFVLKSIPGARHQEAHDDRQQSPDDPADVEPGELGDDHLHEEAARADRADDEEVVAQRRDESRDEAARSAQALDHERVEAAGVDHLLGHLRVADREEQQDHRDDEERCGCAAAVAERDRERGHHDDAGERGDGGQDEEDDGRYPAEYTDRNWFWGEDSGTSSSFARCAGAQRTQSSAILRPRRPTVLLTLSVGGSSTRARIVRGLPGAGQEYDGAGTRRKGNADGSGAFGAEWPSSPARPAASGLRPCGIARRRGCTRGRRWIGMPPRLAVRYGSGTANSAAGSRSDITDEEAGQAGRSRQTVDRFGGLDVVVSCAGVSGPVGTLLPRCDPRGVVRGAPGVNLTGAFLVLRAAVVPLRRSPAVLRRRRRERLRFRRGARHGAVRRLEGRRAAARPRGSRRPRARRHPRQRRLSFDLVDTAMSRSDLGLDAGFRRRSLIPCRRRNDVAAHIAFLASPVSRGVNATSLVSDFGYSARSTFPA